MVANSSRSHPDLPLASCSSRVPRRQGWWGGGIAVSRNDPVHGPVQVEACAAQAKVVGRGNERREPDLAARQGHDGVHRLHDLEGLALLDLRSEQKSAAGLHAQALHLLPHVEARRLLAPGVDERMQHGRRASDAVVDRRFMEDRLQRALLVLPVRARTVHHRGGKCRMVLVPVAGICLFVGAILVVEHLPDEVGVIDQIGILGHPHHVAIFPRAFQQEFQRVLGELHDVANEGLAFGPWRNILVVLHGAMVPPRCRERRFLGIFKEVAECHARELRRTGNGVPQGK